MPGIILKALGSPLCPAAPPPSSVTLQGVSSLLEKSSDCFLGAEGSPGSRCSEAAAVTGTRRKGRVSGAEYREESVQGWGNSQMPPMGPRFAPKRRVPRVAAVDHRALACWAGRADLQLEPIAWGEGEETCSCQLPTPPPLLPAVPASPAHQCWANL